MQDIWLVKTPPPCPEKSMLYPCQNIDSHGLSSSWNSWGVQWNVKNIIQGQLLLKGCPSFHNKILVHIKWRNKWGLNMIVLVGSPQLLQPENLVDKCKRFSLLLGLAASWDEVSNLRFACFDPTASVGHPFSYEPLGMGGKWAICFSCVPLFMYLGIKSTSCYHCM